jgi:hypothetical protein
MANYETPSCGHHPRPDIPWSIGGVFDGYFDIRSVHMKKIFLTLALLMLPVGAWGFGFGFGSGGGSSSRTDQTFNNLFAPSVSAALSITTYVGGNNEVVHPSVVYVPGGWNGYSYWMVATPYTSSNSAYENPSIWASNDGTTWVVPAGLTNPVEAAPGAGNYSDPELVLSPDGSTLNMIFRLQVSGVGTMYLRTSTDGITWTAKQSILSAANSNTILSPTVIYDNGTWKMWVVNTTTSPPSVILYTAPYLTGTWTVANTCTISASPTGKTAWHFTVKKLETTYVMLMQFGDTGTGDHGVYRYMTSKNGVNWMASTYLSQSRNTGWDIDGYRATFLPISDNKFDVFYSAKGTYWLIGRTIAYLTDPLWVQKFNNIIPAAKVPTVPWVFGDMFTRADTVASLGTADSGVAWSASTGTFGISNHLAYSYSNDNTRAYVETGIANGEFATNISTNGAQGWLIFRFSNANNYWRFGYNSTADIRIQQINAGSVVQIFTTTDLHIDNMATSYFRVVAAGSVIKFFINDKMIYQTTDSFNSTATKIGIQTNVNTTRFSALVAKTL